MNVTSVKRIHQSDWTSSGVRFLRVRDIVSAAKNEESIDCLYISKEKYKECSAISGKVQAGDLLVTGVGTIGIPLLIRNSEPLYFKDGNIIWFQNNKTINGNFLYYSFWSKQIQDYILESAGIGTVGTYTIESGKKTPIFLPSKNEQSKIGEYFAKIDNLITLYQRKLNILNKYKRGLYKFIFSNIKEEKKIILKEIIKPLKKTSHKSGEGSCNGKYIFFTNNTSESNKYFDSYDYDDKVIIANTGGVANFKYYEGKFAAMSDCYIFKTSENTRYIYYWLDYMKNKINRLGFRGNGIKHLDKNWFLNLNLKLPSVSDQERIVNILSAYDNLIDKEKQVLNRLQEMKSGLLQQMFI